MVSQLLGPTHSSKRLVEVVVVEEVEEVEEVVEVVDRSYSKQPKGKPKECFNGACQEGGGWI
jgi:hypothetical protein